MAKRHLCASAALCAAATLVPGVGGAHFILHSPAPWAEQDIIGDPQKSSPCGQADAQKVAVPTNAVTTFEPGETITVVIDESVFHPGHYRVVLSTTGMDGLPPDPQTLEAATCSGLAIQDPPVFPVLADGMLQHTEPLEGPQSFDVTLPSDVACTNCTLQVLEFMQSEFGSSDNCFYHHCATISIVAPDAAGDAGVPGAPSSGGAEAAPSPPRDGAAADRDDGSGCMVLPRRAGAKGWALLGGLAAGVMLWRRKRRGVHLLLRWCIAAVPGVLGCGAPKEPQVSFAASPGDLERRWLSELGGAPSACSQGASDPVARELCATPHRSLSGLTDLYDALGISVGVQGDFAVTTHSLGLSGRTVSELNPRTVVFRHYSPLDPDSIVAVATSRGAPLVELVGYDPVAQDLNFYLLVPRLHCERDDAADGGCTPSDLLTEDVEWGWQDWTLYGERDLEDTPLDCRSCHRPGGAGTSARFLMRQVSSPWMHWGDFRGVSMSTYCEDEAGTMVRVEGEVAAHGADLLLELDGPDGRRGGVPIADLLAAKSGYDLSSFLFYATGIMDGPGDVPCEPPFCPFSEPHPFPSQQVLCDRLRSGRADEPDQAWDTYRGAVLAQGFPVPYFEPSVLEPSVRANAAEHFAALLDPASRGPEDSAFARLAAFMNEKTASAVGFLPSESDSAADILTKMCVRCHGAELDSRLGRSRFNAAAIGVTGLSSMGAVTAQTVLERIALPKTSPLRMPPLIAGELPEWAVARVAEALTPLASGEE